MPLALGFDNAILIVWNATSCQLRSFRGWIAFNAPNISIEVEGHSAESREIILEDKWVFRQKNHWPLFNNNSNKNHYNYHLL